MRRKFKVEASSYNSNPTSQILKKGAIEYNGYYIVEDPAGDGYNVYDENFSLVEEGCGSLGSAKECIEQLVENDPERIHCATEEDEVMYQADMANGIQDVEQEDIQGEQSFDDEDRCYLHKTTNKQYSGYQLKHLFKFKEHHGYKGTYEEWLQGQLDSGKLIECSTEAIQSADWDGFSSYDEWKTSIPDYPEDEEEFEEIETGGFWYFTHHGVQPGSIPRRAGVLDMIDTPSGTYVKLDCVLNTKELNEYDMREQAPPSDIMSSEGQEEASLFWLAKYADRHGVKKFIYMPKTVTRDADQAAEIMEYDVPEPYIEFTFIGTVGLQQAQDVGAVLLDIEASSTVAVDASSTEQLAWDDLSWPKQIEKMKSFVKSYRGTKVFEDFAESVGVDVEDVIDSFCDAEAHGDLKVPKSKQKDSDYANDDIYASSVSNYGGAFDIEPEQYFTRDEINEVGDEVCERLKPLFNSDFKLTDAFMDSKGENNLTMEIESLATGEVFFANLQIDRRWGKNPRSMLLKAIKLLVDKFENAINQTSFELSSGVDNVDVDGSIDTNVEGAVYNRNDIPGYDKWKTTPPEEKELFQEDTSEEYVETHLDAVILMDEDGSWTYEDETYPWAKSEEDEEGNWYANEHSNVRIADPIDVVEKVDELLVSLLPEDPGRYHIEGNVILTFNLSGVEYDETFHGWSEDEGNIVDRDYYTDDAEVEFNSEKSSIEHFQWKMVGPGEEVDVQAQEDITAMKDIKYGIKYQMNDKSFDEICDYLYDEWQAGALTEDEYYEMQGYAQKCVDARNTQQDVEAVDSLDGLAFSNWTVADGPHATPANGYDNWTLLEKVGNGVTPRYSMYDNNIDSLEQASAYKFQLSKLSPYDNTEYVWCKYQGGIANYYHVGRRCFSESFICDEDKYEEVAEWQNEVIERCLARLESFNSKLKSNIDHS